MGTYLTSKLCKLSSEYPTFEYDLEKEIMKQRVALQMTKLQTVTGLSLEDFAKEVDLKASNLSRLQSGDHNPTILTLLDLAYRCGYDVEVKVKKKKLPKQHYKITIVHRKNLLEHSNLTPKFVFISVRLIRL